MLLPVLQALNDFIDRKLQASPIKSLIVYPEGEACINIKYNTTCLYVISCMSNVMYIFHVKCIIIIYLSCYVCLVCYILHL